MFARVQHVTKVMFIGAMITVLSGCYLPLRFDAEVEMFRTGQYTAIFDGYIADVGLYDQLQKGTITPSDETEKVDILTRDLKRDPDTSEVAYMKNGVFKVHWNRKGDIISEKMRTFIRRNEAFLTFTYLAEKGEVSVTGRKLKTKEVENLTKIGLGSTEGQLRIKTSVNVLEHNAHQVVKRKGGGFTYIWNITSFRDPAPKLMFSVK